MVEETQTKVTEASPAAEVKNEQETPPSAPAPVAKDEKKKQIEEPEAAEVKAEENKESAKEVAETPPPPTVVPPAEASIPESVSFKEESNLVSDLPEPEKKSLDELKQLIQAALANHEFNPPSPPPPPPSAPKAEEPKTEEPKTDEPKPEDPSPVEPKVEEPATVVETEAPKAEESASVADTEAPKFEEPAPVAETAVPKAEVPAPAAPEEPKAEESAAPEAAVVKVVEVVVDEDGAKTVKAIEETVVSVTPPATTTAEKVTPTEEKVRGKEPIAEVAAPATEQPPVEEFIWGVPLLGDEKSDTVLLKFLRARDFKVKDALAMLKNAMIWRKQFGIESLLEDDLAVPELEKVVFYHGQDKERHPVCYNVYGNFHDQKLYAKAFGDDEKREKFLRWRIQSLEKGIRQQLDFSPHGVCTMVQVTDLKNVPGPGKKELRQATKKALALLQDNYPEFVAKQVFINVPWWYLAYNRILSPFFTQRTKSKFVFAGPSRSAETLFRYIAPEQVPVQYGGLSKDNDQDFTTSDAVNEVIIKPSGKHIIELPATEPIFLVWEIRVLGWDVTYSAEFVPSAEEAYTVLVQKARKFTAADEPYVKNSFKVGEPGNVILTIDNATTKKKKLLYRSKNKAASESI